MAKAKHSIETVKEQREILKKIEAYKSLHGTNDVDSCKAIGLKGWQANYARKVLKASGELKLVGAKLVKPVKGKRTYNKRKSPIVQTIEIPPEENSNGQKVFLVFGTIDSVCETAKKLLMA